MIGLFGGQGLAYLYFAVNVIVLIVNKYVLSTLQFTIPTVFQGWQTLTCVVVLVFLSKWSLLRDDFHIKDYHTLKSFILPISSFALSNVAGSKALADLPVAVFLSGTNLVPAGLIFLDVHKRKNELTKIAGSVVLFYTVIAVFILNSSRSLGWFWLIIHIFAQITYICAIKKTLVSSIVGSYYCNFGSLLILLPLSIYLQEASSALHHARLTDIEFIVGCLISGIFGSIHQIISGSICHNPNYPFYQGISKIFICSISLLVFYSNIDLIEWVFIIINLVISSFLFTVDERDREEIVNSVIDNV